MLRDCKELKEMIEKKPNLPVYFLANENSHSGNFKYEAPNSARVEVGEILNTRAPISDEIYTDREKFEIDLWDKIEDIYKYCSDKELSDFFNKDLKIYEHDWEEAILVYLD